MPYRPRSRVISPSDQQRRRSALKVRIRPEALSGFYAAHSRDVSQGAPQAPRIESRPANDTDFGPDGVQKPDAEVQMPQWHRGVTN